MMKYAIKVPFDGDDMLYLTEGDSKFKIHIKTFDSAPEAHAFAQQYYVDYVVVELDGETELFL